MNVAGIIEYYEKNRGWLGSKDRPRKIIPYLANMGSVLDVGSGNGECFAAIQEANLPIIYTGIDCVPRHLTEAKERFPTLEWLLGEFLAYDFDSRTFDAVISVQPFSTDGWQIEDISPFVDKMYRLATRKVVFLAQAWYDHVRAACSRYQVETNDRMNLPTGEVLLVCLTKSSPAGGAA